MIFLSLEVSMPFPCIYQGKLTQRQILENLRRAGGSKFGGERSVVLTCSKLL